MLLHTAQIDRSSLTEIKDLSTQEQNSISKKLEGIGIDWAGGENINPLLKISTKPSSLDLKAGKEQSIEVVVKNEGINPVYQLRGITESEFLLYKGRELVFGKIRPGESKSWKLNFDIPKWVNTREDKVDIIFKDSNEKEFLKHNIKVKSR